VTGARVLDATTGSDMVVAASPALITAPASAPIAPPISPINPPAPAAASVPPTFYCYRASRISPFTRYLIMSAAWRVLPYLATVPEFIPAGLKAVAGMPLASANASHANGCGQMGLART